MTKKNDDLDMGLIDPTTPRSKYDSRAFLRIRFFDRLKTVAEFYEK